MSMVAEKLEPNGVPPAENNIIAISPLVTGLTAKVILVTPEQAASWLEAAHYDYQRPIVPTHVDELSWAITNLEWEPTAIKIYAHDGREYLVDGQHRLSAIVKAEMPAPLIVVRQIASSINQVYNAYRRLDIGMNRSPAAGIIGGRVHEATGIGKRELPKFIGALKILMNGFQNQTATGNQWKYRNRDVLVRGIYQWQEEARHFFRVADMAAKFHGRRMYSAPVFALALVTLRYQEERALAFWERVAKRDRLQEHSGEWHAVDVITGEPMRYVARVTRRLASCWNAAYEGRTIIRTVIKDEGNPIRVLGTPYNGSRIIRETFE